MNELRRSVGDFALYKQIKSFMSLVKWHNASLASSSGLLFFCSNTVYSSTFFFFFFSFRTVSVVVSFEIPFFTQNRNILSFV